MLGKAGKMAGKAIKSSAKVMFPHTTKKATSPKVKRAIRKAVEAGGMTGASWGAGKEIKKMLNQRRKK